MAAKVHKLKRFAEGNEVVLISAATKKSVRIHDDGHVDAHGGEGQWARFHVVRTSPDTIKLKSVANANHWLRINEHGQVDGVGQGGPFTEFKIEVAGRGLIKLHSTKTGRHLAIQPNGQPDNSASPNPRNALFKFKRPGEIGKLKQGGLIRLKSVATKKNLRITEHGKVDGNGGEGQWATFIVHRVGKNHIKLQSVGNNKHWLRIKDGVLDGEGVGGPWTELKVVRHGGGYVSLESIKTPGHHVGVLPDGCPKAPGSTGTGPHGTFKIIKA